MGDTAFATAALECISVSVSRYWCTEHIIPIFSAVENHCFINNLAVNEFADGVPLIGDSGIYPMQAFAFRISSGTLTALAVVEFVKPLCAFGDFLAQQGIKAIVTLFETVVELRPDLIGDFGTFSCELLTDLKSHAGGESILTALLINEDI